MTVVVLNLSLAILAIAAALFLGGVPERQGAFTIIVMFFIGLFGIHFSGQHFHSVNIPAFLADFSALIGFGLIGVYSKRIWPLWAASLQLLSVGAHFVRALEMPVRPIVYAWMKSGPTWGVILLLIAGTIASYLRRRSRINERSSPG